MVTSEEYTVDKYGQVIIPVKWYNFWTWPPRHKFLASGLVLGSISPIFLNFLMRRPVYSEIHKGLFAIGLVGAAGYATGLMYEERRRARDRVVDHYVSLHPQDFEVTKRSNRKYKDVLLPWVPVRAHERPIPWMAKSEWDKKD